MVNLRRVRAIVGGLGMGKTLLLSYLAQKTTLPVYSNFKIDIPNYRKLEIDEIFELPENIIIYFDEAYLLVDSRNFMDSMNTLMSYVVFQLRKSKRVIYIAVQLISTIDIRFRKMIDSITYCKRKGNHFYYTTRYRDTRRIDRKILTINKASKVFEIFDTYEIVKPANQQKIEFDALMRNPNKLLKKCVELYDMIYPIVTKPTKDSIKGTLFLLGIYVGYAPFLYLMFNKHIDLEALIKTAKLNIQELTKLKDIVEQIPEILQ